ncbi:Hypothetical protein ETEE_0798 [Edwardsiella anguillarum ET080813]|uniref:Uncharacterized protein n=1 Tax=Edwardsiella anguillarum ET080813 TaxID=667120 RepID=A0A076LNL5_9GAMM|nr:Hypothetical protein ETEE_0798 [Edwardsiella anguillarum ET080813]
MPFTVKRAYRVLMEINIHLTAGQPFATMALSPQHNQDGSAHHDSKNY